MKIPALHLVMHAVAIRKGGGVAQIAATSGLPEAIVTEVLARAVAGGRLADVDGRFLLTPAGQLILAGEYSRHYAALRADPAWQGACARFEIVNRELKQIITDWQTAEVGGQRIANDHKDADYDGRVLDRLGDLHERFEPILAALVRCVPRFECHARGLATALARAESGEIAWVSDARLDSYHTVWFELHEDLLRLAGRQREE